MFAVVRTGCKQYRVAAGDKIVVEKIAGDAGDTVRLDDVLLAGEGADLRSTDGLIVSAEIDVQECGYLHEWRRELRLSDHSPLIAKLRLPR